MRNKAGLIRTSTKRFTVPASWRIGAVDLRADGSAEAVFSHQSGGG